MGAKWSRTRKQGAERQGAVAYGLLAVSYGGGLVNWFRRSEASRRKWNFLEAGAVDYGHLTVAYGGKLNQGTGFANLR